MMWVSKVPNYDAYGLFRALHSHNPFYAPLRSVLNMCHWHISTPVFAYRGIIIPLLCSYRGGSQGLSSTYEQAHVDLDLLTLTSCLNYHLLFCYVYTILCISRIFCCICNFFSSKRSKCSTENSALPHRKLAGNHGTESISSFCANIPYLKCIKDAGQQKGGSSVTILGNVQNEQFPRRHFYVPFGEFVHLHMHFFFL